MSRMSFEEYTETIEGKTIDDVITEVKKLKFYEIYKQRLEANKGDVNLLGSMLFLESIKNERFDAVLHKVAYELLFAIVDQKLRAEILESEE